MFARKFSTINPFRTFILIHSGPLQHVHDCSRPRTVHAMTMKRKTSDVHVWSFFFLRKKGRKRKKRTNEEEIEEGSVVYPGNTFDCDRHTSPHLTARVCRPRITLTFLPSNGLDSDSTSAGPQRTYADSLAAPNTVHVPSRSTKALSTSDDRNTLRNVLQSPPTRAQAGAECPHTSASTGQPGAVNHPRRGVQPLESDDEDDL